MLRVRYEPGVLVYVEAYECGGETFGELSCEVGADWVVFCIGADMMALIDVGAGAEGGCCCCCDGDCC